MDGARHDHVVLGASWASIGIQQTNEIWREFGGEGEALVLIGGHRHAMVYRTNMPPTLGFARHFRQQRFDLGAPLVVELLLRRAMLLFELV